MRVLVIAKYNGEYYGLSQVDRDAAEHAAVLLFGEVAADGSVVHPSKDIEFSLQDSFQHNWQTKQDGMKMADDTNMQPPAVGYGWVGIVNSEASLASLKSSIGYPNSPFCRMFNIEIIPLNEDSSSLEIYEHMTPSHWS